MRNLLTVSLMLLCTPALAQEDCHYRSGDGLSAVIHDDGRLDIYGTGRTFERCSLAPTEFETMREVTCGEFAGDLFLVPNEMGGDFPDIIIMPPNILYWSCATPA